MGEPTTEASGRFGGAICKVVVSEPCQRNPRRSAQNHRNVSESRASEALAGRPQNHETSPVGPAPRSRAGARSDGKKGGS